MKYERMNEAAKMLGVEWKMRKDEFVEGMDDHIERTYEAFVVFKDGTSDYYEIMNPLETIKELINMSVENVVSVKTTEYMRLWMDGYCSEWVNGASKTFSLTDIARMNHEHEYRIYYASPEGSEEIYKINALTLEEAIGQFLIENPTLSYNDISKHICI